MQTRSYWRSQNLAFRDDDYSPSQGVSIWEFCPQLAALDPSVAFTFFDDFYSMDSTATVGGYTIVADGGGAQAPTDAAGGVLSIGTDGDDNDEAYLSSIHEVFKFATGKPLWFEARVKCAEANTDDANLIIGLSDTVGADSLLDTAGGPMASYDGAVFFKVDGGTVWQFETSNAAAQVTTASAGAFVTDTWYRLGLYFDGVSSITPYIDGVAGTAHAITLAGLEEMHLLLGAKAGDANEEKLLVDYIKIVQIR